MPATATAPAETTETERAIIDARWTQATVRLVRFSNRGGISWDASKRYDRITESIEELAALLVPDGVWDQEYDDGEDSLLDLVTGIMEEIEACLKAWAAPARYEARRREAALAMLAAQKAGAAA